MKIATLLVMILSFTAHREVRAEEEVAQTGEAVKNEEFAMVWLRFLEGEWNAECPEWGLDTQVKARLIGKTLVVSRKLLIVGGKWCDSFRSIVYWDAELGALVEYNGLDYRVANSVFQKLGQDGGGLTRQPRQLGQLIEATYKKLVEDGSFYTPYIYESVKEEELKGHHPFKKNDPARIQSSVAFRMMITVRRTAKGYVREYTVPLNGLGNWTFRDIFVRRSKGSTVVDSD